MTDNIKNPPTQDSASEKAAMGTVAKFARKEDISAANATQIKKSEPAAKPIPQETTKLKSGYLNKLIDYLKEKFCTEQEVIGVEIQPDMIRLCQAKQNIAGWEIVKIASVNVLNNYQYDNIKKNKSVYSKALKELFEKNKITNTSIALSIPASIAIIKTISLPLMPKENLEKATRIPSFWQNMVQISDNLSEYSIYYRIVKENPETKEMDVLFIASKNEDLKTYIEISKDAGLEPCVIDVGCFSINNISKLKSEEVSNMQVYMKVGRDENYLQVLEQGKPYIYDIFVSDNEKSYLNEFLENPIFQQRFVSQLRHIISKHEDKYKVKIEEVSVISSEGNIDKFINALMPKLENIQIAPINLLENIKLPESLVNNQEFLNTKSSYAVVTGLATRNLDIFSDENRKNVSETVNLLPNGTNIIGGLKAKFYSKIALWGVVSVGIIYILLFGIYSVGKYHAASVEAAKFNEQNKIYKERQAVFNDINAESGSLNKLIKINESITPNQGTIIDAFNEISGTIPEGVWIESMEVDKEGKITITGKSFEEKGIIAFSKSFDNSKNIENISITSLKTTTLDNGSLVKEFAISGKLKEIKIEAK